MKYRLLIVGCGVISHEWFNAMKGRDDIEVAGMVDIRMEAAKAQQERYGISCPIYTDFDIALEEIKPDVVVDLANAPAHFSITKKSLEAGCHVFGEKPMCMTREEGAELLETVKKSGYAFGNFQYLLSDFPVEKLHELCQIARNTIQSEKLNSVLDFIQTGADGLSSYLHIKYSDDGTTFTANNGETVGRYRGELVDTTEADSTTFSDYTWYDMALIVEEELDRLVVAACSPLTHLKTFQSYSEPLNPYM